jgi:hypothetical protein
MGRPCSPMSRTSKEKQKKVSDMIASLTKPLTTNVKLPILFGAILICATMSSARAEETYKLMLKDHRFTPSELNVRANERFTVEVENLDSTPAEFESGDLRIEKFVVGGGKITVKVRALKPGTYKFFDEYNPDTSGGTIVAVEAKPKE